MSGQEDFSHQLYQRKLQAPLWPSSLGITDCCQYVTSCHPKRSGEHVSHSWLAVPPCPFLEKAGTSMKKKYNPLNSLSKFFCFPHYPPHSHPMKWTTLNHSCWKISLSSEPDFLCPYAGSVLILRRSQHVAPLPFFHCVSFPGLQRDESIAETSCYVSTSATSPVSDQQGWFLWKE